jgi:PAS domain S-box-containing protein
MTEHPKSYEELIAEIGRLQLQISKLEKSQAELREAEQKSIRDKAIFTLFEENVDDVMWIMDEDFRFTYVSPSAKLLMGFEVDEILNFSLKDILTPASWQFAIDSFLTGQKSYSGVSSQIRTLELDQKKKDGSVVSTEVRLVIHRNQNGKVTGFSGITRDISTRKAAEIAIKESEELYRAIWENSPVGICITDNDAIYRYVNPMYCKLFGYTQQELIGQCCFDIISLPADMPNYDFRLNVYRQAFVEYEPLPIGERWVKHKDGHPLFVQFSADYIRLDGQIRHIIWMNMDITEQKKIHDELAESEKKYRLFIDNAGEPIIAVTGEGVVAYVNNKAAEYAGGQAINFVGTNIYNIFAPEDVQRHMAAIKDALVKGRVVTKERKTVIKGETYWFNAILQAIESPSGQPLTVQIMLQDITEMVLNKFRDKARLKLLDSLRLAKSVDECLNIGCQAIYDAQLFKRAVLTLHNQNREILHLGQVGLDNAIVEEARKGEAPDRETAHQMTREELRISRSYFVPLEIGLSLDRVPRYIPQNDQSKEASQTWKIGDEFFVPVVGEENQYEGWLSVDTPFNGKRPTEEIATYLEEIVDIAIKKVHKIQNLEKLNVAHKASIESNITLREVLTHIEKEKIEIKDQISKSIDQVLLPAVRKLINSDGTVNSTYYSLLKTNLEELASSSGGSMRLLSQLSPREAEICVMIKNGNGSKEIARALNISLGTVNKYRELIRKKLKLSNKDINLTTFLNNS